VSRIRDMLVLVVGATAVGSAAEAYIELQHLSTLQLVTMSGHNHRVDCYSHVETSPHIETDD
jgi:hypothetical protein